MAYKENLTIAAVESGLKEHCNSVIDAIDAAADYGVKLTDAQNGGTALAWTRTLYGTADTGQATLTVDATAKTIKCLAGAGLFANHRIGRDVQLTNFTNGGNNQTTEITAKPDDDTITIGNATGLVDETDNNARAQENPTAEETSVVNSVIDTRARFAELKDALDNTAVSTADRRADLMDFVW